MDLCTKLSTMSTELNTFSCGNSAIKIENLFCENLLTIRCGKELKKEKELKKDIINWKIY